MLLAFMLAAAVAGDCGPLVDTQSGGDYTSPDDADKLKVVESFHFTADVEGLKRGASGSIAADLGYTLEHFPNHHRALAALVRLSLREHALHLPGAHYSTECYFERALRMRQDDLQVRRLYASFLLALKRDTDARTQLEAVVAADDTDATAHYNLGLLCLRAHEVAAARAHAKKAYAAGFPLPGLRTQLQRAGAWDD